MFTPIVIRENYLQVWILIQLELKKVLQLYLMQVQLVLQTTMILKKYMDECKTEVYSFLNVTNEGLNILNESTSLDVINFDKVESVVEKNIEKIKGIKVKASKFQSNESGIDIIKKSKQVAKN